VQPVSLVVSGAMPPARATSMVFLPDNRADIGWPSIAGRSYRIESSATLDPANWTPVSTVTATESFTIANIVMPDVETFFWRVVEL